MKQKWYWLLIFVHIFLGCEVSSPNCSIFEGKWVNNDSTLVEEWKIIGNEILLEGHSYSISNNDSSKLENLSVKIINNQIYYIARVHTQNQGKEIPFQLVAYDGNFFVFENLQHDFPQRITYNFTSNDSLTVTIEAVADKNSNAINFNFTRF